MKIGTSAIAALSAAACTVFAADFPITRTDPVVVTATRFGDRAQQFPIGVEVISEEDIRRSAASTVPELLSQLAGIRTRDLSGSPDQQVDMRGFGITGDQNTLVLLDGRRISENELATVNWSAIPLSAIERIEILRGSGAVLYGAGATGGTINIITKAPQRGTLSSFVYGGVGTYETTEIRAGFNFAGDAVALRMHGSRLRSDGYRDNNALRQDNAQADLRFIGERGFVSLKAGGDEQHLQLPGSISEAQIRADRRKAATPGDFANRSGGYVDLGGEHDLGFGEIAANLSYREKHTEASFFVATPFRNNVERLVTAWAFTPRLKVAHRLGGWDNTLVTGADFDEWHLDATAGPSIVGRPSAVQRDAAFYAQHTTTFPTATSLSLGGRTQRAHYAVEDRANPAANFSRDPTLNAYEIALRQRIFAPLSVYGKLGQSFRLPNVDDLYSLFTASVTPVEPQTAHDFEFGADVNIGPGRYHVAYYQIALHNEIFFDPITFSTKNLPPTRRKGIEAEARWQLKTLDFFINYTYAVAQFRSGNFGGMSIAGNDVPLVPRHAVNAGASWQFMPRTRANVVVRHVGERPYDGNETNTFGRTMPAYTVVDAKVMHEHRDWQFSAGVRNLFNENYYSYGVFTGFPTFAALPAPERAFFASAQFTFR